jgi:hypothetical protein
MDWPIAKGVANLQKGGSRVQPVARAWEEEFVSDEDMQKELERLRKENAALKGSRGGGVTFRVSEKGAVSVYGLGRFPVTLYQEQWDKLLRATEELRTFIDANRDRLKKKEQS